MLSTYACITFLIFGYQLELSTLVNGIQSWEVPVLYKYPDSATIQKLFCWFILRPNHLSSWAVVWVDRITTKFLVSINRPWSCSITSLVGIERVLNYKWGRASISMKMTHLLLFKNDVATSSWFNLIISSFISLLTFFFAKS